MPWCFLGEEPSPGSHFHELFSLVTLLLFFLNKTLTCSAFASQVTAGNRIQGEHERDGVFKRRKRARKKIPGGSK
jgi:hypothetical protein